jgi:GT2 family glycosyltransferase
MNPIVMICYNNLELTKQAVESALVQDIEIELVVVNNGSTDGTRQWLSELQTPAATILHMERNESPCKVANAMLKTIFANSPYVLGIPNDAILPPNCYSQLLKWPRGFVCATDIGQGEIEVREAKAVSENTPMSVMLIRRWAHDALVQKDGYFFDEGFFHYASDCDLALRMAACGIRGVQLDVPFWHYGSASWRLADTEVAHQITSQADRDRDYFQRKWGFSVSDPRYGESARDINFLG